MIEYPTEANDPRLDDYLRLTDVRLRSRLDVERGLFMAESYNVISRAFAAGCTPRSFLLSEKWRDKFAPLWEPFPDVPVYIAPEALLEKITGFHLHRGALAAMHRPELPRLRDVLAGMGERSRIAIFEDIVDHTNLGAAFRSAAAIGVDAVLVTPSCADPLYRRSIRVSMGTVFQVPWTRIESWPDDIDLIKECGYIVAGMTLGERAISLDELVTEDHQNLALVFGTEGQGLTRQAERRLDRRVTIPMMHGVDSLNVAASAAVAFYATR
ncbi:TrmH family RNA methyltransferase [Devriesea agamarum]|uniref:TrmH family RNA methyltransferase n=1 Tax=Devriesea agamarum TaxID=472569 RepID=UPI00071D71CF|nr:RNA methyltransferase [Devriesea agamarum]